MVTPELKAPTTNFTPSATNLLATDTPCLGSDTSSPKEIEILLPRMPPLALRSATACSAPFLSWAPNAAFGPVIGPSTPSLTWAAAVPAVANAKAKANPSVWILFIRVPLFLKPKLATMLRQGALAPAHRPAAAVDPAILRDHLAGPL